MLAGFDVAVVGGGLAGLTLAKQLRRMEPRARLLVAERERHPVPEAAFKVGESTSELGAHYLRSVVGLEPHLLNDQIVKLGLRFFFSGGGNRDLGQRVEAGLRDFLSATTYQVDRGRLENALGAELTALGVDFRDGTRVTGLHLDSIHGHRLSLSGPGGSEEVQARWVIDASGRTGVLKKRFKSAESVGHRGNAAWFRVAADIDLDEWSDDADFRSRMRPGRRRLSTTHLMGRGYWVWFIPLASGTTSVGLVADPELHPFEEFASFDKLLDWMRRHEPQCAKRMEVLRDRLLDFRVMRRYAYGCRQVFSGDRWALTGEAGVFIDPLYSPGTDFIAMANTLICDLVRRDLAGETDLTRRARAYDRWFLSTFEWTLKVFEDNYRLMGNAQVMSAKAAWDFVRYWGSIALFAIHGKQCDLEHLGLVASDMYRLNQLDLNVQRMFREWDLLDPDPEPPAQFLDYSEFPHVADYNRALVAEMSDQEIADWIRQTGELCEEIAVDFAWEALRQLDRVPITPRIDPYEFSLLTDTVPGRPDESAVPSRWGALWLSRTRAGALAGSG